MSVLTKMYYGLDHVLSTYTSIPVFTDYQKGGYSSYIHLTDDDQMQSVAPNAGSTTFTETFNIDYYSNNKGGLFLREAKSKIIEVLGQRNSYQTASTHYYFYGEVEGVIEPDEDDKYKFRIKYKISHSKVS